MSALEWIGVAYFLIAAVICVATWIENSRTFYVYGPPSGVGAGLTWPLWALLILCVSMAGFACRLIDRIKAARLATQQEPPHE